MSKNKKEVITTGGFLSGKKTYITAIIGVITAIGGYLTGDFGLVDTVQTVLTAVLGATIRASVGNK
jgi:hypothetical protein